MPQNLTVIVLAAGGGTRMKSKTMKVLHPIGGRSMIGHVLAAVQAVEPRNIVAVVVGESLATVAAGLLGGAGLIVVASRWLTGVLFQTSSNDVVVITQTTLILLMVTAAAVSAPVMRALRTDPARVLRLE